MTDKEKLMKLLNEFEIGYELYGNNEIICKEGNKIDGYMAFFTYFSFDENGKFVEMGAGE